MILCIDSGNSRIKWGLADDHGWLTRGSAEHGDQEALRQLRRDWPRPARIMLANVAGETALSPLRQALGDWSERIDSVAPGAERAGVRNGYANPQQLGVDRWCALIGARHLVPGALVVVMAGTATTIDALDADGRFLGGLILPGQGLMLRALARDTAALPLARGTYQHFPRCTDDAIVSGAIEAQVGAIERLYARLEGQPKSCLLSGGNADALSRPLRIEHRRIDDLPLEGLRILAQTP